MASAIELNARATILNEQGIGSNPTISSAAAQYLNLTTVALVGNIFSQAMTFANSTSAGTTLMSAVNTLGNVSTGRYLLDFYPSNVIPVCSTSTIVYGNTASTTSFIKTFNAQGSLPFEHGMAGFANLVSTCRTHSIQSFDTVASIGILENKTYAQSGLGFKGVTDLATNGLGSDGEILGTAIRNFGTMFDIQNINLLADPYVFGQNLINQGLGQYGDLSVNLQAAGLDPDDITKVPDTTKTIVQTSGILTKSTMVGEIQLPVLNNQTTTNIVTGSSNDVILDIYSKVTGNDLAAIVSATGITTIGAAHKPRSLADYLDIRYVIDINTVTELSGIGVKSLGDLGKKINSKLGQGTFTSWKQVGTVLENIVSPVLNYSTSLPNDLVLSSSTISTLRAVNPVGTGAVGIAYLVDYIGACSDPTYAKEINNIIKSYNSLNLTNLLSGLRTLDQAVATWIQDYVPAVVDIDGNIITPAVIPSVTPITTAISLISSSLNSLTGAVLESGQTSQYQMLSALAREVSNLASVPVVFKADPSPTQTIKSFSENLKIYLTDKDQTGTYYTLSNVILNNAYGDTIRALSAEVSNADLLSTAGIIFDNDPNPTLAIYRAKAQNIPLTTYLSQNK
jgi:hypothetical protein